MRQAVILVENEFQDEEVIYPRLRLIEAEFSVKVVGPTLGSCVGKHGIKVNTNACFLDLANLVDDTDIVIVPGGWRCPEKLRCNDNVLRFISDINKAKKIIGAICHGPQVLISAGIVLDRKMTCYYGMRDDLMNAGAKYLNLPVVVDDNIITASHYDSNPVFMREILKLLKI